MKSKLFWFVCELTSASGLQFCGVVGGLLWCVVAFTCSLCVSPCCMWFSTRVLQQRSRLIRTRVFGPDSVTDSSLRGFSLPSSKSLKVTEMNQKVLQNQSSHKCLTHFCFYWINRPELKRQTSAGSLITDLLLTCGHAVNHQSSSSLSSSSVYRSLTCELSGFCDSSPSDFFLKQIWPHL